MKLIFELPVEEKTAVLEWLGSDTILYCVPADMDYNGRFCEGWTVITQTRVFSLINGEIRETFFIKDGTDYKAVALVGNGVIEATFKGESRIIARYSMSHVPRYTYIAKILTQISEDKEPTIRDLDDENRCPKCGRVFPQGSRVCPACINKLAVIKRLWGVVKPHWPLLAVATLIFWILTGLTLIYPSINRGLVDNLLSPDKGKFNIILVYVGAMALADLLRIVFGIIRGRIMVTAGGRLSRDLRELVYQKIQSLSINYLSQKKTGDLMNRVTGDTNRIQNFIQNQASMGINEILVLLGVSIILFVKNWKLALMIILPAPLVMIICRLVWNKIHVMFHAQWRVWDKANSILQDIFSGIKVVKTFGQEEKEISRFNGISKQLSDTIARNEKAWNTLFPALGFLLGFGNFLVLYYGGHLVIGEQLSLGELVQFSQYAGLIYGPLQWLSFIPRWFTEALTATERVFEVIDEEPEIKDHENALRHQIKGDVIFKNVTFGYRSHEPVVEDINLEVAAGEMIGLVGHSGAGKSTLINLIMRLYDVNEGQVLIDDVDIRDICQQDLRSQIGVVLQETFLFSGTILENIRYSKPDASLEEIIQAAKIANAHDFIVKFPDGYDTKVGERGQRLSGGERQMVAIARAILHDPKILILDEATASLDTETEQQIQEALGRLVKDRTTFAIAHRLSTLKNATRIVVIDKGRKAEVGTHTELIRNKGIYYNLVMAQRKMSRTKEAKD